MTQEIFETLYASARIIALLSSDYLQSKVCKEEFNIALFRNREAKSDILFPIYLKTAALPTYMKLLHHTDCRKNDLDKLRGASINILRNGLTYREVFIQGKRCGRSSLPPVGLAAGPRQVVGKIQGAVRNRPGPASVFVHARAYVKWRAYDVGRLAAGERSPQHDMSPSLLWPALQPIDVVAVKSHLRQTDGLAGVNADVIGEIQDP